MAALIVAIFLWVVVVPVALALIARFMVARTARARRRATRVSMWLLPLYFASIAAVVALTVVDAFSIGAYPLLCFALVWAGVSPLVGMAVLYATEFAQLEKSPEVCDSCGYLRQGAAGVRCPECGVPWGS